MLITAHVTVGALVGRAVRRPLPAVLLGVVSHFACDALPHWGNGPADTRHGLDEQSLRVAVADGLTGLALIALVARAAPRSALPGVLAGITGACLPDMDKPGRLFFDRSPFPPAFDRAHVRVQRELPQLLASDAAVAVLAGAALVRSLGRLPR